MYKTFASPEFIEVFRISCSTFKFYKAADELFVTQAAVSHQIKLLEDFLGVELFYTQKSFARID